MGEVKRRPHPDGCHAGWPATSRICWRAMSRPWLAFPGDAALCGTSASGPYAKKATMVNQPGRGLKWTGSSSVLARCSSARSIPDQNRSRDQQPRTLVPGLRRWPWISTSMQTASSRMPLVKTVNRQLSMCPTQIGGSAIRADVGRTEARMGRLPLAS